MAGSKPSAMQRIARGVLKRLFAAAYDSASASTRRSVGWSVDNSAMDSIVAGHLDVIRARSRDEVRKNTWASQAIKAYTANVIGTGIKPYPVGVEEAERKELMDAWNQWVQECDADGNADFYGFQQLLCRAQREAGEVFVRFRDRLPKDGMSTPLQLQMIEGDHVPVALNRTLPNGGKIVNGIELSPIGKRSAFMMYKTHPQSGLFAFNNSGITRIPAEQILHIYEMLRPGQMRGIPSLAVALTRLYEMNKVSDAMIMRFQIMAMFAGFIEKPDTDSSPLGATIGLSSDGSTTDNSGADTPPMASLEPGTIQELADGEKITWSEPPSGGDDYEAWVRTELRGIAAALDITYEQLTGDLSNVNFSSIRAGLVEKRLVFEQAQQFVYVTRFCRPVWNRWYQTALIAGSVRPSSSVRRGAAPRVRWIATPGYRYVDPEKEIKALVRAIRAGIKSLPDAIAEAGGDPVETLGEIAAMNKKLDEQGIVLDSDPRKVSQAGVVNTQGFDESIPGQGSGQE